MVSYRPQKSDPNRSRLTLGGYQIVCLYDVSTPTSDLPTIKMLCNSVLSSPGAKFFTVDVANFYLGPPMDRPEFIILPVKIIPQEIIDNYKLSDLENDGWVYTKIVRGMYGLPQAGKIDNDLLKKRLEWDGYYATQFKPGLWIHAWRPLNFTLVVDDFGFKSEGDAHANHLAKTFKRYYDVTVY